MGSFWEFDSVEGGDRCKLVEYETQYSVYNGEDYKRCVCNFFKEWGEDAETFCPQEESNAPTCQWSFESNQSSTEMPVITTNLRILVTTTDDDTSSV